MREALDDFTGVIQIGDQGITNLRYADDIVLMTQSEDKLQELVTRLDNVCGNKYDFHVNIDNPCENFLRLNAFLNGFRCV